jgi:Tfp pilus assembly protein PilO
VSDVTTSYKWIAGAVVIAVAIFAGSWFLLVSPKRAEATDIQAQADAQVATNASLNTELSVLKQQKKDLPAQQARLAGLRTQVPQTADMPSLIQQLDTAAAKSGVALVSLSPQVAVPVLAVPGTTAGVVPVDNLTAINADIVVSGGYFEIVKFLNSLENLDRYVLVTKVGIVKDETVAATDSTSAQGAGQLTATLNSRVFVMPETTETTPADPAAAPATVSQ